MTKKNFFKKIRKLGILLVGYTFLKAYGIFSAIVLERLLTEYLYAVNHNTLIKDYYFQIDINEIAESIGLSEDTTITAMNNLSKLKLISLTNIKNQLLLHINEENIIRDELYQEIDNDYKQWDHELAEIQKY